jgi:hypothetical protein
MEKARMFPCKKKRLGEEGRRKKNRMKVKMKVVNMLPSKCFFGESENDEK